MAGLSGMKQICCYCNYSEVTILKWIRLEEFPATKVGGAWISDTDLVDKWRQKRIVNRYRKENPPINSQK